MNALNKRARQVKIAHIVLLVIAAALCVRFAVTLVESARIGAAADKNPMEFLPSLFYMLINSKDMFLAGIWTTVRIALFGTAIAFVLAVLLVFVRVQVPQRQDKAGTVVLKEIGALLSKLYITVIRGTPMMVQTLIIYYIGFGIFKGTGMSVTDINRVWSCFISGLITVSLNSTAYLTEVLRGGIESIDPGQAEAARSLGMSNWQTMLKVVFPQAVKNSIPAIGNEFIINIKDSSVLSVIGCYDLMFATTSVVGIYYKALPVYTIAAVTYLILTCLSSLIMRFVAARLDMKSVSVPSSN
ncbi:MAG: amino acid ABC transporter permease [Oscillospiraceae bacterium]|nr:amino acid ABC transporter permease [Oscillospiraceae bacterium]